MIISTAGSLDAVVGIKPLAFKTVDGKEIPSKQGPRKGEVRRVDKKPINLDVMLWGRIYIDEAHQRKSVNTHYMLIIKSNSSSNMLLVTSTPFEKGPKDLAGYIEAVQHREAWKSNLVTKDYTFDKLNTMQNDFQAVRRELKGRYGR